MSSYGKYFMLFANCIPVRGVSRSTICDLQRGSYLVINNELFDALEYLKSNPITTFLRSNKKYTKDYLISNLNRLIEFEYGCYIENRSRFTSIDSEFHSPYKIQDCILELSNINYLNIEKISKELTTLGCQTIELRSYDTYSLPKISKIVKSFKSSRVRNVEIYVKYDEKNSLTDYTNLLISNPIIGLLVIHSCENDEITNVPEAPLIFTKEKINSSTCCGNITKNYFKINLENFLEGLKHNSCLSRKISINSEGTIKNCPSLKEEYGNIKKDSLINVVENRKFRMLWSINKDQIDICKDCEFRYICSDCRAYTENPKNNYSKPLKCGYNPYTNKWGSWKERENSKELIKYYQLDHL